MFKTMEIFVRFFILMAVSTKVTAFWDVAQCNLAEIDRRFRGAYCLHHQGTRHLHGGGSVRFLEAALDSHLQADDFSTQRHSLGFRLREVLHRLGTLHEAEDGAITAVHSVDNHTDAYGWLCVSVRVSLGYQLVSSSDVRTTKEPGALHCCWRPHLLAVVLQSISFALAKGMLHYNFITSCCLCSSKKPETQGSTGQPGSRHL
jgi:hypothetical protein